MINTLVAGRVNLTEQQKRALSDMGFHLVFHPDERTPVSDPDQFEVVICNGLFQYQPIKRFGNLHMIQLTSAGLDRVPLSEIQERGISLYNAENTYSVPMAEFAIGGVLQLYKNASFFYQNKENHLWDKDRNLQELFGKNVLILGTGHVGSAIAKRFKAFECMITGLSRSGSEKTGFDKTDNINNVDDYLPEADILVLALPLTKETEQILNNSRLQSLKETAVVVNIARGKLTDENAMAHWLEQHPDAGAVLDVFEEEPLPNDNALWDLPNVVLSPHNSFVGNGNAERLFQVIKKNFIEYYESKPIIE